MSTDDRNRTADESTHETEQADTAHDASADDHTLEPTTGSDAYIPEMSGYAWSGDTWGSDERPGPSPLRAENELVEPERDAQEPQARRRSRLRAATAVTTAAGVLGLAALSGYETGRTQWSPPSEVTTVNASPETFAAQSVFKTVEHSVVKVSVTNGGTGTGFFYGPNRIATNAHVVTTSPDAIANATGTKKFTANVTLADGRVKEATVVAMDHRLDLAILAVEPGLGVEPLGFAKSSVYTTPGAPVAVVGYPFGGPETITTGVLSAVVTNSQFAESDFQAVMMQIDASVNPGNSGGPLLDSTGAVLGVVTLRPDDVNERPSAGVALALTGDQVKVALRDLEKYGEVRAPKVGIELGTAESKDQKAAGALVTRVVEGSPALAAGITVDDVVTHLEDRKVASPAELIKALAGKSAGQTISLTVRTGTKTRAVELKLGAR